MKIDINDIQKDFILKAIWLITTLYDFDSTTEKKFKDSYGVSKAVIKKETYNLSEALRE